MILILIFNTEQVRGKNLSPTDNVLMSNRCVIINIWFAAASYAIETQHLLTNQNPGLGSAGVIQEVLSLFKAVRFTSFMPPMWMELWLALWHTMLSSADELEEFSLSRSLSLSSEKRRKKYDLLACRDYSATWMSPWACLHGGSPVVPSCSSRSAQWALWHAGFSAKSSFVSISEAWSGPEKPVMWNGPVDKQGRNYWEKKTFNRKTQSLYNEKLVKPGGDQIKKKQKKKQKRNTDSI